MLWLEPLVVERLELALEELPDVVDADDVETDVVDADDCDVVVRPADD